MKLEYDNTICKFSAHWMINKFLNTLEVKHLVLIFWFFKARQLQWQYGLMRSGMLGLGPSFTLRVVSVV